MKFLHLADIHIGMENYGRLDASTGLHTRVQDFVKCIHLAFNRAIREKADFVIFCGDAYKTCDPNPTHQRELAAQIRTLVDAKIPLVMIIGNHDNPVSFGRASSIDIFGTLGISDIYVIAKPRLLRLDTRSGPVQIAGLPWPTRSLLMTQDQYKDLSDDQIIAKIQQICASIIDDFARELDPAIPAILAAHLTGADATFSGSERSAMIGRDPVLMTSALANPAFDYVALGHIHKFQDLNQNGAPPVVYPGSVERIDFGEEKEPKGFCIVIIKEDERNAEDRQDGTASTASDLSLFSEVRSDPQSRMTSYEFIETPARRFRTIQVDVNEEEDPTDAILQEITHHSLEDAVVRVIYHVSEAQQHLVDLKRIHAALQDTFLVASILPKIDPVQHLRRVEVSEDLGVREALERYIENHPELEALKEDMKRYAAALESALETSGAEAEPTFEEI